MHGALLRMNRSIQAEGAYGTIKWNRSYTRARRRGLKGIVLEISMISCGFNLHKYHLRQSARRLAAWNLKSFQHFLTDFFCRFIWCTINSVLSFNFRVFNMKIVRDSLYPWISDFFGLFFYSPLCACPHAVSLSDLESWYNRSDTSASSLRCSRQRLIAAIKTFSKLCS